MNSLHLPDTLGQLLTDRATSQRQITFISGQDDYHSVTYSQMYERALHRLADFQSMGLHPGCQLIIQSSDNASFIEAFWACLLGGIVAIPVAAGNSSEQRLKLFRIAEKLSDPALFTQQSNLDRLAQFSAEHQLADAFDRLNSRAQVAEAAMPAVPAPPAASLHQANTDDIAFIQFSSGSTSTPKGVVLTHRNLLVNAQSIIDGCQMSTDDLMVSWMPLTHDMGLIGFHLTPLICNISHCLIPTDVFVRRPSLWLTETARTAATILCSPNFGYQHVLKSFKPERHADLDLSSVRLLFNGAEPISASLCQQFVQTLRPFGLRSDAMYPVYGLAEASLAVTFPPLNNRFSTHAIDRRYLAVGQPVKSIDDPDAGVTFVAVGQPLTNVQVEIRAAEGSPLPENTTGHICIRGDNVTAGYYQEPELTAQVIDQSGWLDTGDLGYFHDQQLYITGRAKDIVFVSGQNVYPHDLEEILIASDLAQRGKIAISSHSTNDQADEQLLIFILHRGDAAELTDTARSMTRVLSIEAGVRVHAVVPVPRIPKTTSGKVQRFLLVEALQRGEYQILLQSDPDGLSDVQSTTVQAEESSLQGSVRSANEDSPKSDPASTARQLLAICNEQVEQRQIEPDDNLFELGISSLTLAQIHAAIEDTWPNLIEITDLFDYPTVRELASYIDSCQSPD